MSLLVYIELLDEEGDTELDELEFLRELSEEEGETELEEGELSVLLTEEAPLFLEEA